MIQIFDFVMTREIHIKPPIVVKLTLGIKENFDYFQVIRISGLKAVMVALGHVGGEWGFPSNMSFSDKLQLIAQGAVGRSITS